jgi:excisionase family DNA binding protein
LREEGDVPSHAEAQSGIELRDEEILTLPEAAAYLRVPERALAELATAGNVPAREIGGEWRFSRRALADWLRFPSLQPGDGWRIHPRWLYESPFLDEFILLLEKRLLMHLQQQPQEPSTPRPGSKQAVLRGFGLIKDDADLQEQLEIIRKQREAGG